MNRIAISLICVCSFSLTAHGKMTLSLPRAQQAPEIDGVLADGEWDDAAAVTGVSDEVLPPWTPLETAPAAGGLRVSPWGRTYHVDARGLFNAIDTQSQSGIDAKWSREPLATN